MKQFLIIMMTVFCFTNVWSQAHNMSAASSCKMLKSPCKGGAECQFCPVCRKVTDDENAARAAEDKRRAEVIAAKAKADKEAIDKAYRDKLAEEAKQREAAKVYIATQPTAPVITKKPEIIETGSQKYMLGSGGDNRFHYGDGRGHRELIPRPNNQDLRGIRRAYGAPFYQNETSPRYLYPAETGVIQYGNYDPIKSCNGNFLDNWDIVDINWNTLFNDESVHYIEHFFNNWFLIGYLPCDEYEREYSSLKFVSLKLYNAESKEFIEIKIDNSFVKLSLAATAGLKHSGMGTLVFHNEFYYTGVFKTKHSQSNIDFEHGSYELLIDELSGGSDMWKAATCIQVFRSLNGYDAYFVVYILDKDDNFKSFTVSDTEFRKYY